jgi:hypothetical protein
MKRQENFFHLQTRWFLRLKKRTYMQWDNITDIATQNQHIPVLRYLKSQQKLSLFMAHPPCAPNSAELGENDDGNWYNIPTTWS